MLTAFTIHACMADHRLVYLYQPIRSHARIKAMPQNQGQSVVAQT